MNSEIFSNSLPKESSDMMDAGVTTSQISKFYDGRSVFITGASGFVGTVLLETLLRCCPGVKEVYLLLREKKGASAEERKHHIFQKKIFTQLRKCNEDVFEKIRVVEGDVTQDGLNISCEIIKEMQQNVSVVFHCAAVVSFLKNLRDIIFPNVIGTENVIKLCRKLPNLEAFVHCSTSYSNCNRKGYIEEKIYGMMVSPRKFIEATRRCDDETLEDLVQRCVPHWPNTYCFSKALGEELIVREAKDLPVSIVRPSTVVHSWKGSLPGYVEEGTGFIDICIGVGKGFIRVIYCHPDNTIDVIPVDVVANTMIAASWYIGVKKPESPLVVNCTGSEFVRTTWGNIITLLYELSKEYPLPRMYQKPYLVLCQHRITYWASSTINHYAPAICIDAMLRLLRKKPILTKMYRLYDKLMGCLRYFVENEWKYQCDNMRMLISLQNPADSEMFPMNGDNIDLKEFAWSVTSGGPFYEWTTDRRSQKERMAVANRRYMLTNFLKSMTVVSFLLLLFSCFFSVANHGAKYYAEPVLLRD